MFRQSGVDRRSVFTRIKTTQGGHTRSHVTPGIDDIFLMSGHMLLQV